MNGPIVAQAGIVCLELRETLPGRWAVRCAGEHVGDARSDGLTVTVTVGDITVGAPSVGRAAVLAAVRLNDEYWQWRGDHRPATATDLGGIAGEAA